MESGRATSGGTPPSLCRAECRPVATAIEMRGKLSLPAGLLRPQRRARAPPGGWKPGLLFRQASRAGPALSAAPGRGAGPQRSPAARRAALGGALGTAEPSASASRGCCGGRCGAVRCDVPIGNRKSPLTVCWLVCLCVFHFKRGSNLEHTRYLPSLEAAGQP